MQTMKVTTYAIPRGVRTNEDFDITMPAGAKILPVAHHNELGLVMHALVDADPDMPKERRTFILIHPGQEIDHRFVVKAHAWSYTRHQYVDGATVLHCFEVA